MPKLDVIPTSSRPRVSIPVFGWAAAAMAAFFLLGSTARDGHAATNDATLPSPKPWLMEKVEQARELSQRDVKPDSPAADALKKEFKDLVDDMLDWEMMTRRSLGRSWKDLSAKQQGEFSQLLRKLIESSYQSKMRMASKKKVDRPKKVSIKWGEPEIKRQKASIQAKVKADKSKTFLGFELVWNGKRWRVYDVVIDDVSTVRTYRSQFRKLIKDEGFPELMSRMQAKLADIEAGRAEIGSP